MTFELRKALIPAREAWRIAIEKQERSYSVKIVADKMKMVEEQLKKEGYRVSRNGGTLKVEW